MIACRKRLRRMLKLGTAVGTIGLMGMPAHAQNASEDSRPSTAVSVDASIVEQQSYALRLMTQIYDGSRDFSHTQLLGVGRVDQGGQSFTRFDFGDGAVVITGDDGALAAARFMNVSPAEEGIFYDRTTKTVLGDSDIAGFHNSVIRPLLGRSPELGRNAEWVAQIPLTKLGLVRAAETIATAEMSREYFVHDGKQMVLVHYAIPAFVYTDSTGETVVHWGSGLSLSDPGFGVIYLNTALHRAVARGNGGSGVPYRFSRTMVAANPDGSAKLDYRTVPQLAEYVDEFFNRDAMQVVPTNEEPRGRVPIDLARALDLVALSIVEDGASDASIMAGLQTSTNRGLETTSRDMSPEMRETRVQPINGERGQ